jgi:hypothetical protein
MCDVSPTEIEAPLNRKKRFVLDLLRDQLAKDDLLSEVLASDNDPGMAVASGAATKGENCTNYQLDCGLACSPHCEIVHLCCEHRFLAIFFANFASFAV